MTSLIQVSARMKFWDKAEKSVLAPLLHSMEVPVYGLAGVTLSQPILEATPIAGALLPLTAGLLTLQTALLLYRLNKLCRLLNHIPSRFVLAEETIVPQLRAEIQKIVWQLVFKLPKNLLVVAVVIAKSIAVAGSAVLASYLLIAAMTWMLLEQGFELINNLIKLKNKNLSDDARDSVVQEISKNLLRSVMLAVAITGIVLAMTNPISAAACVGLLVAIGVISLAITAFHSAKKQPCASRLFSRLSDVYSKRIEMVSKPVKSTVPEAQSHGCGHD